MAELVKMWCTVGEGTAAGVQWTQQLQREGASPHWPGRSYPVAKLFQFSWGKAVDKLCDSAQCKGFPVPSMAYPLVACFLGR